MLQVVRRVTAGWLVAAFVLAAVVPLADTRHALFDDLLCIDPVQPGGQTDRFRTASDAQADDHCAVCHLQRAVRHAAISSTAIIAAIESGDASPTRPGQQPAAAYVQHSSSRAPPAL